MHTIKFTILSAFIFLMQAMSVSAKTGQGFECQFRTLKDDRGAKIKEFKFSSECLNAAKMLSKQKGEKKYFCSEYIVYNQMGEKVGEYKFSSECSKSIRRLQKNDRKSLELTCQSGRLMNSDGIEIADFRYSTKCRAVLNRINSQSGPRAYQQFCNGSKLTNVDGGVIKSYGLNHQCHKALQEFLRRDHDKSDKK